MTFLILLPDLAKIFDKIFKYLYQSNLFSNSQNFSTKDKKKEILKVVCISKKIKYMDDLIIIKALQITTLRDLELI